MRLLLVMHCRDVRSQGRLDSECLSTLLALVFSRLRVRCLVVLELLFRHKAFVTPGKRARKWLVPCVTMHVSDQLVSGRKAAFVTARPVAHEAAGSTDVVRPDVVIQ